ncbi:phosphodiester glycosidase family protein [Streptomyces sp. H34-S4]|uniref:phosphodiester glycosidase family protein n=1 Tax=Streptomyces sp. H34-S4 TaxID=2996463 RepID=UPI002271D87E|nr:phosphodiester glycosidase family protein [Streptomyces sp. H34-S4]MCY0934717.1 phosphodiester glycosidase family protein [Streptomyces sp. H34-S4]
MTLTTTGRRRGALATATALTSVMLLVSPGASSVSAAASAPTLTGWTALDTQHQQLDPGVDLFRYQETSPNPLRKGKRELNVLRIDPALSAVRIESTYGHKAGESEIVRDQLNQYGTPNDLSRLPLAGINASYFTDNADESTVELTESQVVCKDSRTTLGVDDQGRTVIVTITGTRDEPEDPAQALATFDGAFLSEVTRVFTQLKVMDAINFDRGGSTMLLTRDPSNPNNYTRQRGLTDQKHRPVFDSVYVGVGGAAVTPGKP